MISNNVRQHNCFIIQGSYLGFFFTCFDLLSIHLQAYLVG